MEVRDAETRRIVTREHWVVRKRYTDLKGRDKEKKRIAYSVTEAQRLMRKIEREIEDDLAGVPQPSRTRTVSDLIAHCKKHQFKPAVYSGDRKIGGQRTWRSTWNALKPVEKFFGKMLASEVEYEDVQEYKEQRLAKLILIKRVRYDRIDGRKVRVEYTDTRPRSFASVNRELSWTHRVFEVALQKKWITANPMDQGDALIETSVESQHLRILSFEEEVRLFAAFDSEKKRKHLAFAVTFALETAIRKCEQFARLDRVRDVDLKGRLLTATSYKGKKVIRRRVPITGVLLPQLAAHLREHDSQLVFDLADPKKAFANSCKDAGITGVTWHSLRHTAITRMVHTYKLPAIDVMKISGHTTWKTFFETYVNIDEDMVRSIGAAIDSARAAASLPVPPVAPIDDLITEVSQ
jgi:integrase